MSISCCLILAVTIFLDLNEDKRGKLIQMCETVLFVFSLLLLSIFSRMNESCYECM
jgi:hypothetical protein